MDIVKCAKFVVYLALFVAFIAMSYKVGTDQNSAPIKKGEIKHLFGALKMCEGGCEI